MQVIKVKEASVLISYGRKAFLFYPPVSEASREVANWFIGSLLSLRRGITLNRSSSPKMGPLTLVQTLFNVVLLLYHSKKFFLKHSKNISKKSTAQFRVRSSSLFFIFTTICRFNFCFCFKSILATILLCLCINVSQHFAFKIK